MRQIRISSFIKNIKDFYILFEDGRVFSEATNKFLEGEIMKNKQNRVRFRLGSYDGKPVRITRYRLLCLAFIPNPENFEEIDHIDRNPTNDALENLRWADRSMNSRNRDFGWKVQRKLRRPIFVLDRECNLVEILYSAKDILKYHAKGWNHTLRRALDNLTLLNNYYFTRA